MNMRWLLFLYPTLRRIPWLQQRNSHPVHGAVRSTITRTKTENGIISPLPPPIRAQKESVRLKEWLPTMSQKVPPKLYIPTDEDVKTLLGHIQRAVVLDGNKQWVDKTTKSVAGNRYVPFPDFVMDRISGRKGRIVHLKPNQISDRFIDLVARSELPRFRFHDLRHYCASIQHALGVPDAYIMQRGGWGSDAVLKQVYRHALSDQSEALNHVINDHFSNLCNTKYHTK